MSLPSLSRRERQIMDVVFRLGNATAAEVRETLPDPPSYSAVRAHLRILEDKGHITHEVDGPRYVYSPTVATEKAGRSALRHMVATFFDDSPAQAVAALLDSSDLTDEDFDRLHAVIARAREEGR